MKRFASKRLNVLQSEAWFQERLAKAREMNRSLGVELGLD
jgi:hypothetical protein